MQIHIRRKKKYTGKFVAQNENQCQLNSVFVWLSHFCVLLSALSHVFDEFAFYLLCFTYALKCLSAQIFGGTHLA